ncbi:hypothetical protein TNCT_462951, partial [Trichonephila clavata]
EQSTECLRKGQDTSVPNTLKDSREESTAIFREIHRNRNLSKRGVGLEGKKETARAIKDYSKICEAAASLLNKRKLPRPFRSETRAIYSDYNGKTPSRQAREISAPSSKCESERRRYRRGCWRRDELEEEEATRALSMPVVATIKVAILV